MVEELEETAKQNELEETKQNKREKTAMLDELEETATSGRGMGGQGYK